MAARSSIQMRLLGGCCLCAIALFLALAPAAHAHAGLIRADPVAGAALGASPTAVRLTFSERPQASLSQRAPSGQTGLQSPVQVRVQQRELQPQLPAQASDRQFGSGARSGWGIRSGIDVRARDLLDGPKVNATCPQPLG